MGVATDENFIIKWDSLRNPRQNWWTSPPFDMWGRDHTLRSAIRNSVVWYYQEIARKVGEENYKKYLQQIGYGNQDISGGLDSFWLSSSLKISADEQLEFLKKLYANELGFSKRSTDIVRDILVLEKTEDYTLSAKTGGG